MESAKIFFSDKSSITINEKDHIVPVISTPIDNELHATKGKPIQMYVHIHEGLIPAIMDALCQCNFFYINGNNDVIYGSHSIIKIENL